MSEIHYIDRESNQLKKESVPAEGIMNWLYGAVLGKATLHLLMKRKFVSAIGGWFMNSKRSQKRIGPFIEKYGIDMSDYTPSKAEDFKHFNDFFYRKVKKEKRPIGNGVVSPADGKTLAFQALADVPSFFIKGSEFSLTSFLKDSNLVQKYEGGSMVIIRLAPTDYHRFHFPQEGQASTSTIIKGHYFSVSPIALRKSLRIFCENQREHCTLTTKEHGDILIVEVGATMVGSIIQTYEANSEVKKGDEKGYFAFGGSTLVLLFEKGKVQLDEDLIKNTQNNMETQLKMGDRIGI